MVYVHLCRFVENRFIQCFLLICIFAIGKTAEIDCLKHSLTGQLSSFDHEQCQNDTEGCVQFVLLPTENEAERRFFGCISFDNIAGGANVCNGMKWYPRHKVIIEGREYIGQMLCCTFQDMCNEEFAVALEGIYEARPIGYDGNELIFHGMFYAVVVILVTYPFYFFLSYLLMVSRRKRWERFEIGRAYTSLPQGCDEMLYRNQNEEVERLVEDGKIHTLQEMQNIYDAMRQEKSNFPLRDGLSKPRPELESVRVFVSEKLYKASADMVCRISRSSTRFDNLLFEMLCFGPVSLRVKPHNLANLFADLYDILAKEPPLIELPGSKEYIIIGDLRGEYRDLHRWLRINGYPPHKKIIVLGGMIENENIFSLETFVFLAALKVSMPYDVYLLRGATESLHMQMARTESWNVSYAVTTVMSNIFERLPVAALINSQIFCVHSGISPKLTSIRDIHKIDRSRDHTDPEKLLCDLLFSEYDSSTEKYRSMSGGRGHLFGPKAVHQFCEKHRLSLVIRAHNPVQPGFFLAADGRLLSIWSSPGYECTYQSATAVVHADLSVEIVPMSNSD